MYVMCTCFMFLGPLSARGNHQKTGWITGRTRRAPEMCTWVHTMWCITCIAAWLLDYAPFPHYYYTLVLCTKPSPRWRIFSCSYPGLRSVIHYYKSATPPSSNSTGSRSSHTRDWAHKLEILKPSFPSTGEREEMQVPIIGNYCIGSTSTVWLITSITSLKIPPSP